MRKEIKTKQTFGTVRIDHFSPNLPTGTPRAINMTFSFEEALKLHLGLLQALGKLNSYDRSTKDGRDSGINLCVFTDQSRITINEDQVGSQTKAKSKTESGSLSDRLKEYEREVRAADLEPSTKQTYIHHAQTFVRWTQGTFKPGSKKS